MNNIDKLIIVQHSYGLATPKTQRMLAAAKTYIQEGVDVVFIISSDVTEPTSIGKIRFIQIEENKRKIFSCFQNFVKAIKSEYSVGSAILFDGAPLYSFLFRRSKYNVFAEITEIPYFGHTPSLLDKVLERIRFYGVKGFTGIQVISNSLKEYYTSKGIKNIEVVNMFVDASRFEAVTKQPCEKYIGYCGTLSLYKDGVDDLIRAFSIFSKSHPDYQLRLFGGFESEAVEEELRRITENLKVTDKVIFAGRVSSSEMPQLLKNAEILALARPNNKQAQYGFPTKLGEYLATGNPVVVTAVGDIPNFLKDNVNALLVGPCQPLLFANKLSWIADHTKNAKLIGACGYDLIKKDFSSDFQTKVSLDFLERFSSNIL